MNLSRFIIFLFLSLFLSSCGLFDFPDESTKVSIEESLSLSKFQTRCLSKKLVFREGFGENLYGLECIEGKSLQIKTQEEGELVVETTSAGENLKLEKEDKNGSAKEVEFIPNIINKYYKVEYEVLDTEENRKLPEWLKSLLSKDFDFYGLRGKEYRIVFKTVGNYLVLYKATKDVDDLPYDERSVLAMGEGGVYEADSGGYYKVPFIGYKLEYCDLKHERDDGTGDLLSYPDCEGLSEEVSPKYVRFDVKSGEAFKYVSKKNVFPAHYFTGKWLVDVGYVKDNFYLSISSFVEMKLLDENEALRIEWKDYEKDCESKNCSFKDNKEDFKSFGERESIRKDFTKKPSYIKILFPDPSTGVNVGNITVTENYFSYDFFKKGEKVKFKNSFLKIDTANNRHFHQRRWFPDNQYGKIYCIAF